MASGAQSTDFAAGAGQFTAAALAARASASRDYVRDRVLLAGPHAARNLADAAYHLCILHGRHPGLIDLAAAKAEGPQRFWLETASDAFAQERGWLTQVVVAAGPLPSTPHQAECEAAVVGQRHAIEMLARSDRAGCAIGAAAALLADWRTIRGVLDAAAVRFGLPARPYRLPDAAAIDEFLAGLPAQQGFRRAVAFGAEQVLVQHRGLWDLLETRAHARDD